MYVCVYVNLYMHTYMSGRRMNWWADQGEVNVVHGKNKDKTHWFFSDYNSSGFKNLPCLT